MTDLQETEARLQAADNSAHAELRKLRQEIETVATDDVAAYADALTEGGSLPKARAAKIKERVRDIELRVIPGIDEAMWRFVAQVRDELRPDADDNYRSLLNAELKRWQPPATGRRDQPVQPRHLKPRPKNIVQWVESGIGRVDRVLAEAAEKADRKERQRKATAAVNRAQAAYEREQRQHIEEEESRMTPLQRNNRQLAQQKTGSVPWRPFDRYEFLKREGLLEDYGYVQPGQTIQVQGGREQRIEQVPASELAATNATEA